MWSSFAQGACEERPIWNDGDTTPAGDRTICVIGKATVLRFVSSIAIFWKTLHVISLQAILKVKEGVCECCSYTSHGFEANGSCNLVSIVIEVGEGVGISIDITVIEVKAKHCSLMVEPVGCRPVTQC